MAAHYANGGLPPWVAGGVSSGKAPLPSNYYNVTYPPNSHPKAGYQNSPTQFGVYGNLPPVAYTHTTGIADYSAASYHVPPVMVTAPNPMSFPPNPQISPPALYTQISPPALYSGPWAPGPVSPLPGPYGVPPPAVYSATRPPPAVASGSGEPIPAYSGDGMYGAAKLPTETGWEHTNPLTGTPVKQ
jgi:hypothetical protein